MALTQLKPFVQAQIECKRCNAKFHASSWTIAGIHNMSYGECDKCKKRYYKQLPVNAGMFYPGILNAENGDREDSLPYENWFLTDWIKSYKSKTNERVEIAVEKNRSLTRAKTAILNTIDSCYGHCLFELFNASFYLKRDDIDLIIIVQKNLRWLVPEGAAEIWVADISFGKASAWYDDFDKQIKGLTNDITNLFICGSFVQTDESDYNIEDYSRVKPFPLEEWNRRLKTPVVTFVWRSDRFWKNVLPKLVDNRFTRKLFPEIIRMMNRKFQLRWVVRFAESLKKDIPTLDFAIAGMDDMKARFPSWIKDYRFQKHTDTDARKACQRYAESHLVLGCNGSSLILPSCHAGSVIDIVPMDQWAASAGSFAFRNTSFGDTQFRYLLLPPEVTIRRLVLIVISMLRDRALIELHTSHPWRNHDAPLPPEAWANFRLEAFEVSKYFRDQKGLVTKPKK